MSAQQKEKNYQFRRFLNKVHLPDRRDPAAVPAAAFIWDCIQTWVLAAKSICNGC